MNSWLPGTLNIQTAINLHLVGHVLAAEAVYAYLFATNDWCRQQAAANLANSLADRAQWHDAADMADKALALLPSCYQSATSAAVAAYHLNQSDRALNYMDVAARSRPNDPDVLCRRGALNKDLKRFDSAMRDFMHSIAVDPNHAQTHMELGMLLLLLGDFENGWREYEWRLLMPGRNRMEARDAGALGASPHEQHN